MHSTLPAPRPLALGIVLALASACSATSGGEILFGEPGANAGGDGGAGPPDGRSAFDVVAPQGDVIDGGGALGDGGAGPAGDGGAGPAGDGGAEKDAGGAGCGPRELCANSLDDDCDGMVDEGCACIPGETQRCYPGDPSRAGRGVCTWGTSRCEGTGEFGTWSACEGAGAPRDVVCGMGMDFRCNGMVDEGCVCEPGARRACYTGPAGTEGVGACRGGTQTCDAEGRAWGSCQGEVLPAAAERCDGSDADCDGMRNEGCVCVTGANRVCYGGPSGTQGVGICRAGTQPCVRASDGSTMWSTACNGEVRPAAREVCGNNLDDNCNGMIDEGCVVGCPDGRPRCGSVCCPTGEACAANVCVGNGQLRFTLTWDVQADLDLHVVPPCGTEIYYGRLNACGGSLDRDSCPALAPTDSADRCVGPENVFWAGAPASGTYLLCVNPWQMRSGSTARFTLQAYRGTTLVRTWTGTRSGSASYVACRRGVASFVDAFTL